MALECVCVLPGRLYFLLYGGGADIVCRLAASVSPGDLDEQSHSFLHLCFDALSGSSEAHLSLRITVVQLSLR